MRLLHSSYLLILFRHRQRRLLIRSYALFYASLIHRSRPADLVNDLDGLSLWPLDKREKALSEKVSPQTTGPAI